MRKQFLFLLLTGLISVVNIKIAFAQFPPIQWQHSYGGSEYDNASTIIPLGDTGFIISGTAYSYNGDRVSLFWGGSDFWMVNVDNYGGIKWEKSHGGNLFDDNTAMTVTNTGYLLAGVTNSVFTEVTGLHGDLTNPDTDCWIAATDKKGDLLWQKCFGGSKIEMCYDMINTDDGNHIFAGITLSNDGDLAWYSGLPGSWVVKFNDTGGIIWQKVYDTSSANSICQTSDHGYLITGATNVSAAGAGNKLDLWLLKINDTGGIVWRRSFGGTENDWGRKVIATKDGGAIIAGYANSTNGDIIGNHGGQDLWVLKVNNTGNKQWSKVYGGSGDDEGTSIIQTFDGGYLISGVSNSTNGDISTSLGGNDIWLLKLDTAGALQWQKSYGGSMNERPWTTIQTADSGFIVAGSSKSNDGMVSGNHGDADCWVFRLDKYGVAVPPAKSEQAILVYPKPASTIVYIEVPMMDEVTIKLFDITGRMMDQQSLHHKSKTSFDISNYPRGVYTYHITCNKETKTGNFTVK